MKKKKKILNVWLIVICLHRKCSPYILVLKCSWITARIKSPLARKHEHRKRNMRKTPKERTLTKLKLLNTVRKRSILCTFCKNNFVCGVSIHTMKNCMDRAAPQRCTSVKTPPEAPKKESSFAPLCTRF